MKTETKENRKTGTKVDKFALCRKRGWHDWSTLGADSTWESFEGITFNARCVSCGATVEAEGEWDFEEAEAGVEEEVAP